MRCRAVEILSVGLLLVAAGCSKQPEGPPPESFPKPIEVIEDDAPAPPEAGSTTARASPEFECVAGAAAEQGLVEAEPASTRDDGAGRVISVASYKGEGLTIFGLPASYVQRLTDTTGWSGVGAYVESDEATVTGLITARFPNTRTIDGRLVGDGMAHPIILQGTDQGVLYIECAPVR